MTSTKVKNNMKDVFEKYNKADSWDCNWWKDFFTWIIQNLSIYSTNPRKLLMSDSSELFRVRCRFFGVCGAALQLSFVTPFPVALFPRRHIPVLPVLRCHGNACCFTTSVPQDGANTEGLFHINYPACRLSTLLGFFFFFSGCLIHVFIPLQLKKTGVMVLFC